MPNHKILNFLGILLLTAGLIRFLVLILTGYSRHSIWFSNHVLILLGIGVLIQSRFLVTAELSIVLIPETLWSLHFLSKVLFNKYLFGVTRYVFDEGFNLLTITSMHHLLIVPLGMLALFLLGVSKNAWKGSFLHISLIWILSFLIGEEYNINCIFKACLPHFKSLNNYFLAWPLILSIMVLLSNKILFALNFVKDIKKRQK